jgi:pantetheine-phosphate adenylyltransferase
MKICVYPGSFDPVTYGHLDIINRAAQTFDKVIVAIGVNNSKKYTFSVDHRVKQLQRNVVNANVEVIPFTGLLADFAYENNAHTIIKGVRNNQDFDYERLLHEITITQQSGIDTHILVANQKLSHVSSSAAKELCKFQGLIQDYVPLNVKEDLEWVLNNQFIVGVTGSIGMGKSYVSDMIDRLLNMDRDYVCPVHNIDLDKLAHKLYESKSPVHVELRNRIVDDFNLPNGFNRKDIGDIVFNDEEKLRYLNSLVRIPLLSLLRNEIKGKTGLILLNGALLVESEYLSLCNNNVVLVSSSSAQQYENLDKRGLSPGQIGRRMTAQMDNNTKLNNILTNIAKHKLGTCIQYMNEYNDPCYNHIMEKLIRPLGQLVNNKKAQFRSLTI